MLKYARVFTLAEGVTWRSGERTRTETNLGDWISERAQTGRVPPNGFPVPANFPANPRRHREAPLRAEAIQVPRRVNCFEGKKVVPFSRNEYSYREACSPSKKLNRG